MSGHVVIVIPESGMVENMGVAAGIASPALSVQEIISPSGSRDSHFEFPDVGQCRAMSLVSYLSRAWSKMWGYPLELRRNIFPSKVILYFLFWWPPF